MQPTGLRYLCLPFPETSGWWHCQKQWIQSDRTAVKTNKNIFECVYEVWVQHLRKLPVSFKREVFFSLWSDTCLDWRLSEIAITCLTQTNFCESSCLLMKPQLITYLWNYASLLPFNFVCSQSPIPSYQGDPLPVFTTFYLLYRNYKIPEMPVYGIKEIKILGIAFFFSSPCFNLMALIVVQVNYQGKLILHRNCHSALTLKCFLNLNGTFCSRRRN